MDERTQKELDLLAEQFDFDEYILNEPEILEELLKQLDIDYGIQKATREILKDGKP